MSTTYFTNLDCNKIGLQQDGWCWKRSEKPLLSARRENRIQGRESAEEASDLLIPILSHHIFSHEHVCTLQCSQLVGQSRRVKVEIWSIPSARLCGSSLASL